MDAPCSRPPQASTYRRNNGVSVTCSKTISFTFFDHCSICVLYCTISARHATSRCFWSGVAGAGVAVARAVVAAAALAELPRVVALAGAAEGGARVDLPRHRDVGLMPVLATI